jgi:WD40 repeat protein
MLLAARVIPAAWLAAALACGSVHVAAQLSTTPLLRLEGVAHTARIGRLGIDAAGAYLVTGSDDKTARVWDLASGKLLQVLRPPQGDGELGKVYAVALAPDGGTVAVGGAIKTGRTTYSIYLFDRDTGQVRRRLRGLPNVVLHVAFSPDGAHLAAALGGGSGVWLYRTGNGQPVAHDSQYGADSNCVDFDRAGRLLSTSYDGYVRLYDRNLKLLHKRRAPGGTRPHFARFSPDGERVAVGFGDAIAVNVLSGSNLEPLDGPATSGMDNGVLSSVAWSADGASLYAGGRAHDSEGRYLIVRWADRGRGPAQRLLAGTDTVTDLGAVRDGRVVFAGADAAWGMLGKPGQQLFAERGATLDHRGNEDKLRVSSDGTIVEFGFDTLNQAGAWKRQTARFTLATRQLSLAPALLKGLRPPDTRGVPRGNWKDVPSPIVNGQALRLAHNEVSRSLAFSADGQRFLLGTNGWLRFFDRPDRERWARSIPSAAWAVNLSPNGRFVLAALGDGTIRWYASDKGRELLALFVHPDGKRWIAWTPEGFFDAAPRAQGLIGYHLNQGKDKAGEFVAASQLSERFFRPDVITGVLSASGQGLVDRAAGGLGDVRNVLAEGLPPQLDLLSPAQTDTQGEYLLKVRVKDRGGGVGRLVYRIDGVEVEGRPADIPGASVGTVGRMISLALGPRVLTVAAANGRGVESKPVVVKVNVQGPEQAPSLFVLAVGITQYRDNVLTRGVRYASGDAQTVAGAFEAQGGGLFRKVTARALRDQQATRANIEAAAKELAALARPDDVFVIYLAGHGTALDGEYYFLPWEVRYTSRQALLAQSLNRAALQALLRRTPARKTLLVLDTCSSAAVAGPAGRGLDEKLAIDRMARISGRAVLAAAGSEQMALEGEQGHGVFTYALLQGLRKADRNRNSMVEVGELADFVEELVPDITRKRWGYEQIPFRDLQGATFPVARKPKP